MKKILILIGIVLLIAGGYNLYRSKKGASSRTQASSTVAHYRNSDTGISFIYPKVLTASTTDSSAVLHHDISYPNHGACDMKGDSNTYERLTDFNITLQVSNAGLVETMKHISPYIPEENFINRKVVESKGFIEAFTSGTYKGYAIYEGAEGCGQTTYYFPLSDSRTLVVKRDSIQALSDVIAVETRAKVLAVPGVISREQSDTMFVSIMKSVVVN